MLFRLFLTLADWENPIPVIKMYQGKTPLHLIIINNSLPYQTLEYRRFGFANKTLPNNRKTSSLHLYETANSSNNIIFPSETETQFLKEKVTERKEREMCERTCLLSTRVRSAKKHIINHTFFHSICSKVLPAFRRGKKRHIMSWR